MLNIANYSDAVTFAQIKSQLAGCTRQNSLFNHSKRPEDK